ncbi:CYTH domain-containing protein [Lapidilactobacillus bayanensis]|uniref:CYTH domain-containing protein n=1 Tax=Lapidilactobacillus bayanensis TaxID=2485998 RepID=UPI000F77DEB3|nr:CYTH domain-containing protein [Lapidilactobacillus bayanensis]
MAELEVELKNLVTADQFAQIQQLFNFAPAFTQTNYYFDTADQQLYQQHSGLRLRIFDAGAEQTLKVPASQNSAVHHNLFEITDPLTRDVALKKKLLTTGHVAQALSKRQIKLNDLTIFASAITQRRVATLPVGELTLDCTTYPNGQRDYELELETKTPAAAQKFFVDLLRQLQIPQSPVVNKVERAAQNYR